MSIADSDKNVFPESAMGPPVSMSPSLNPLAPIIDLSASAHWPAMVSIQFLGP